MFLNKNNFEFYSVLFFILLKMKKIAYVCIIFYFTLLSSLPIVKRDSEFKNLWEIEEILLKDNTIAKKEKQLVYKNLWVIEEILNKLIVNDSSTAVKIENLNSSTKKKAESTSFLTSSTSINTIIKIFSPTSPVSISTFFSSTTEVSTSTLLSLTFTSIKKNFSNKKFSNKFTNIVRKVNTFTAFSKFHSSSTQISYNKTMISLSKNAIVSGNNSNDHYEFFLLIFVYFYKFLKFLNF